MTFPDHRHHDQEEAMTVADRIAASRRPRQLIQVAGPSEIYEQPIRLPPTSSAISTSSRAG